MSTLVSTWRAARDRLSGAGIDTPAFDARLLLEAGAGISRMDILTDPHRELSESHLNAVEKLIARRAKREPVARILGAKQFWTMSLAVTPAVLCPRPETEILVAAALDNIRADDADAIIADLGTGSGAIAIALALERPRANVFAVEHSADALEVARFNAKAHTVAERTTFVQDDWGASLPDHSFTCIVTNPPYIPTATIAELAPEVRFDPIESLDGGSDGLDAYRALLPGIARLLKNNGYFALEIGQGQAEAVWALASAAGLEPMGVRKDWGGVERVVEGHAPRA